MIYDLNGRPYPGPYADAVILIQARQGRYRPAKYLTVADETYPQIDEIGRAFRTVKDRIGDILRIYRGFH